MPKGIKFKNNYLTGVIFRIDFSTILNLSGNNKEAAAEFRKAIFNKFPNVQFRANNNINIQIDVKTSTSESLMEEGELTWIFSDKDNKKSIELTSENLILHYNKNSYVNFEEFLEDVILILNALEYYNPYTFKFLGLRYINQINEDSINEKNICEYINKSLINNILFELEEDEEHCQTLSKIDLIKNGYDLTIQYGFFNPMFPNPKFKKDFILDYDCRLRNLDLIQSKEDIIKELKKMNQLIYKKFKYSVTEKLFKIMEKNDEYNI